MNLLIAPRGEFSPGALALKRMKKRVYLCLARLLGLYSDVYWHASTEIEAGHILRQFPSAKGKIYIAADPVSRGDTPSAPPKFPTKNSNRLRAVFISRISPMKNLDGLIKFLGNVQQRVDLSIYGPIEDAAYWQKCMALINALPLHITVEYHGPVNPGDVQATFAAYDLFILPTQGENFGHVIFEALCAGTPVLTSDRTPWVTSVCGAVTALSLSAVEEWSTKIEEAAARCQQEQDDMRKAALEYASLYAADDTTRLKNLAMFRAVASSPRLITGFPLRGP